MHDLSRSSTCIEFNTHMNPDKWCYPYKPNNTVDSIINIFQHSTTDRAIYRTFYLAKLLIFVSRKGPSTHVIDATSFVQMWNAAIGAEEMVNISSYETLSADKNRWRYHSPKKLLKNLALMSANSWQAVNIHTPQIAIVSSINQYLFFQHPKKFSLCDQRRTHYVES